MPIKKNVKRAYRPRKPRAKKSSKIPAAVRTYVNRTISRSEETKVVSFSYGLTSFNAGINTQGDLIGCLPQIYGGTTSSQRIGNYITPVKLVIRGFIIYDATDVGGRKDAKMIGARLFCFSDKTSAGYANQIYNYNLLDEGDGTSGNWTGATIQFSRPHNKEQFKWYCDKRMKILKPFGVTNATIPSTSLNISSFHSSMYQPFTITLTKKHLPAKLIYDDTDSSTNPVNFAPRIALGYCDLTNASPDTTITQLQMQFESTLYFKDS